MPAVDPLEIALSEREYISRFSSAVLGIIVHVGGVPTDVDGAVAVTIVNESSEEVWAGVAHHPEDGTYDVTLSATETSNPGLYMVWWEYEVGGDTKVERSYFEVGHASPTYDSLHPDMKLVVESVNIRFADLFDSPLGGPHLQVHYQTNFGRERLAQLLRIGLGRLNTIAQPHQTYSLIPGQGNEFPVGQWGPLLEQVCFVEVVKHLRRSYVEQPDVIGVNVARLDRRGYMDRWGTILRDEQADLDKMIDHFKVAHMGLGHGRLLVAGGIYGRLGYSRHLGLIAHRPAYIPKFY